MAKERGIEILINVTTTGRLFEFNCDSHSCPSRIWLNLDYHSYVVVKFNLTRGAITSVYKNNKLYYKKTF